MKVIQPITIDSTNIISSNLYETAPTAYVEGTTYGLDAYASVAGLLGEILIYRSLQAGNIGHTPSSSPTWWVYSSSTYTPWVFSERAGRTAPYQVGQRVLDTSTHSVYESLIADNTSVLDAVTNPIWGSVGTIVSPVVPSDYSALTTYALGDLVISGQSVSNGEITAWSVYKSLQAANLNHAPPSSPTFWEVVTYYPLPWLYTIIYAAGEVAYKSDNTLWKSLADNNQNNIPNAVAIPTWLRISPSNTTAPFDSQSTTQAIANKEITFTIQTGIIDTVGLIGTDADSAVITVRNGLGGTIVYQRTLGLTGGNPANAWDYYFSSPTLRVTQAIVDEIPPYVNSYTTITLTGTGTIGIGNILFGKSKDIGLAEYGVQSGILDFSTKTTDTFGQTTFVKRGYKKRVNCRAFVDNDDLNQIQNTLYALRATPCLWILSNDPKLSEVLLVYGFYKDFSTEISYPTVSYINYEIEGLI